MFRRLLCAVTAATLAALSVPAAAQAATIGPRYYLALGDSLAYGYQPTHVTGHGYADQLFDHLHASDPGLTLVNLGCPGETTATFLGGGVCAYPGVASQLQAALAFLDQHRGQVRLITVDIGANDLDGCAAGDSIDFACVGQGLGAVTGNGAKIVAQLRAAALNVTIAGMTYYDPFLAHWRDGGENRQVAVESIALADTLNAILAGEYRLGGFRVADVAGAFAAHDLISQVDGEPLAVARICQWTYMCAPAPLGPDIHANNQGYGVIAEAFARVL